MFIVVVCLLLSSYSCATCYKMSTKRIYIAYHRFSTYLFSFPLFHFFSCAISVWFGVCRLKIKDLCVIVFYVWLVKCSFCLLCSRIARIPFICHLFFAFFLCFSLYRHFSLLHSSYSDIVVDPLSLFLLFYLQSSHLVLELCYVQYYFILIITVCILWHRLGDIFSLLFLSIFALLFFVRLFFLYFCQFSVAIYYAAPHNS